MATLQQYASLSRSDIGVNIGKGTSLTVGDHYQAAVRTIGIVEETIVLDADIEDPGIMYLRNDDDENWVDVGFSTGDYPCRIYPTEQAQIPLTLTQTTIYLKADTAACLVEYFCNERQGVTPSTSPSASPSATPTASTSVTPTASPSGTPSTSPSVTPTATPTASTSATPTGSPSPTPSTTPTTSPTTSPSPT